MTLLYEVKTDAALRAMVAFASQLGNLTIPNKAMAVRLTAWVDRNFKTSGSLIGGWAPLGPMSLATKPKKRWSLQPLLTTGAALTLQRSFLAFHDATRVGIGTEVPYAEYHQVGVPYTRGRVVGKSIPARPMLPNRAQVLEMAHNVYGFYVQRARAQAGL